MNWIIAFSAIILIAIIIFSAYKFAKYKKKKPKDKIQKTKKPKKVVKQKIKQDKLQLKGSYCDTVDKFLYRKEVKLLIVISKIDKLNSVELNELKEKMNYYELLGYRVLYVNSLTGLGLDRVKKELSGKVTILSGQTGAGKSTLINAIYLMQQDIIFEDNNFVVQVI